MACPYAAPDQSSDIDVMYIWKEFYCIHDSTPEVHHQHHFCDTENNDYVRLVFDGIPHEKYELDPQKLDFSSEDTLLQNITNNNCRKRFKEETVVDYLSAVMQAKQVFMVKFEIGITMNDAYVAINNIKIVCVPETYDPTIHQHIIRRIHFINTNSTNCLSYSSTSFWDRVCTWKYNNCTNNT